MLTLSRDYSSKRANGGGEGDVGRREPLLEPTVSGEKGRNPGLGAGGAVGEAPASVTARKTSRGHRHS